MKHYFTLFLITFLIISLNAQIGINTTEPQAALDITSTNTGLLIPRVSLTNASDNTTVTVPSGSGIEVSTLVYNDGTAGLQPAGFYYWDGASWLQLLSTEEQVYVGKFTIGGTGNLTIAGLPFEPKNIEFKAYANVETYDLDADNGTSNNDNNIPNYFGSMYGYAKQLTSNSLEQQVIAGGGNASSINDHSRYASSGHCIGIRYADNNGTSLGLTNASLSSFNQDGFTLNVTNHVDDLVVIYTAYKY